MIGQKEGWEGQAEWEGLGSKGPVSSTEQLANPPPTPPILNDILLLKILFSEIYRAPKGQQLPLYPPGLGEEATVQKDFYRWLFPRKILFSHYKHDNGSGHMFQV